VRIEIGSATDIGRVRERNEDSLLIHPPLFIVADGMGGHRGGDVASRIAVETMERLEDEDRASLAEHVRGANRAVWQRAGEDQRLSGMGTTLTAVRIDGDHLTLAHVGDSRAYLLRDGTLSKLTTDHTLVERMLKAGEITPAEAEVHPHKNVMTRALGTEEDVEVDEEGVSLEDGDRLLLCSDGLTGMVTEDQIQAILEASPEPQNAAERLVRAANRAGGVDNISVVVLSAHTEDGDGGPARRGRAGPRRLDRRTVGRWALRIGIPILVLLVLAFAARWYLDRQWYVAPNGGSVAIYQGVPLTILGYDLGRPYQTFGGLPAAEVAELPGFERLKEGVSFGTLEAARAHIEQIREELEQARRQARRERRLEQEQGPGQDGGGQ
jgi:serine/threonine protein phosphatase PrpC